MSSDLEPKLISVLREGYSWDRFSRDLTAGVIVGIVALPLAIAFAIASGVKPEQGLYTAIVGGFIISAFSGSRVQIGGPTGAFIVLVASIVHEHGYEGLAVATIMAGVLLLIMGLARLGSLIQFIPYPVTVGFTAGIAIIIATGQVRDSLGLPIDSLPPHFLSAWSVYLGSFGGINPYALAITLVTMLLMLYWRHVTARIPGSLVALIGATVAVQLLHLPVETIGSRFGSVAGSLPVPHIPDVSWEMLRRLSSPALAIALLGGIESLLSAVVADGMTGRRHRSNIELVAQGLANIATPLFGGIPATGAIARTATNIRSGGVTPVAGMIHACVLLLILWIAGEWAALIPMACLAGILLIVAWNMSELHLFAKIAASTRSDVIVLLATFSLTVLVDLTVAIQVGFVLASLLFLRRMANETTILGLKEVLDENEPDDPDAVYRHDVPAGVEVFEINGPFFFGAVHKFRETMATSSKPQAIILRLRRVMALDATGLRALEELVFQCRIDGTELILSGVHSQPLAVMQRSGLLQQLPEANVHRTFAAALQRAGDVTQTTRKP
ncbi:MAG: sulfate permease [bacterium]|nr:sulfate permease [bacterium]